MKVAIVPFPKDSKHQNRGIGLYTQELIDHLKRIEGLEINVTENFSEVDLIHYTFFDLFRPMLPIFKKKPTIVTIHDLTPLILSSYYPLGMKAIISLVYNKFTLKNCHIITDSESSKKDIVNLFKTKQNLIRAIYLAVSNRYRVIQDKKLLKKVKIKYDLPDRFCLFVGNVNPNKNILRITEGALKQNTDIVLVGGSFKKSLNLDHAELKDFKKFKDLFAQNPRVHILGFVEDSDLVSIINLSQVLLLPSLYEGFGLPILEAQSCGVPVITSKTSSMPEVAGDGAILVDPYSIDEISKAIRDVLSSKTLCKELISNGYENLKRFYWEKTATETFNFYKEVLGR